MIVLDVQKKLVGANGDMLLQLQCEVAKGQLVALYGESGAGKTSTLRMLAGLLTPDKGSIVVEGKPWFNAEKGIHLAPQNRRIGVVFQDYALFPNMSVRQNLTYALGKRKDGAIIAELMEIMGLGDLAERRPKTLSGGQQQRVALARALVQRPKILLLDEPLSALDARTRLRLQDHLLQLHKKYGLTTILVSHDVAEVHKLSDWVFVLKDGKLVNQGPPSQVFMGENISGKFKFVGEVLQIEPQDVVYVVTVLVQNQMVKVVAQETEVYGLSVGDKVMVVSKAFNPIIRKLGT